MCLSGFGIEVKGVRTYNPSTCDGPQRSDPGGIVAASTPSSGEGGLRVEGVSWGLECILRLALSSAIFFNPESIQGLEGFESCVVYVRN